MSLCCAAALPATEVKTGRRKSRSAEHFFKHSDEDEDAYQSAKCYFDLKVRLHSPIMLCQTCGDILNRTSDSHSMQECKHCSKL